MLAATQQSKQTDNTDPPDPSGIQGTSADSARSTFVEAVICSRASTPVESINAIPPKSATPAIPEKARLPCILKPSVRPNSTEACENERLNREACWAREFVHLSCWMLLITTIDIAEAMVKAYKIWPKEVIPCINKCMGTMTFKVLVGKVNMEKVANWMPKIKGTTMMVDDCNEDCSYKYEIRGCTAQFSNSDVRHTIMSRISTEA
jgi:hypothetical protein